MYVAIIMESCHLEKNTWALKIFDIKCLDKDGSNRIHTRITPSNMDVTGNTFIISVA